MPVPCPFCETNTHGDHDKDQYPECERVFIASSEALELLNYQEDGSVHVFIHSGIGLVGMDWSKESIDKLLMQDAKYIELCDLQGVAREMSHGISVSVSKRVIDNRFLETDETKLRDFEIKHRLVK